MKNSERQFLGPRSFCAYPASVSLSPPTGDLSVSVLSIVFHKVQTALNLPISGRCSKEITIGSREDSVLILSCSDSKWCAYVLISSPKRWVLWYTHPFTLGDQSPVSSLPPFPVFIWNHLSPSHPWAVRTQDSHLWVLEHPFSSKQSEPRKNMGQSWKIRVFLTVSVCPCAFFDYSRAALTIPLCLIAYRLVNMIAWDMCI